MYSTYIWGHMTGAEDAKMVGMQRAKCMIQGQCFGLASSASSTRIYRPGCGFIQLPTRLLPYIPIQNTLREGAKIWPELSSLGSRSHGWTTARRLVIDSGNKTSGNSRLKTKGAWHEVHQEFWDLTWILCFGRRTLQKLETMNNSEEMHQFECFAVNWDHEEWGGV